MPYSVTQSVISQNITKHLPTNTQIGLLCCLPRASLLLTDNKAMDRTRFYMPDEMENLFGNRKKQLVKEWRKSTLSISKIN